MFCAFFTDGFFAHQSEKGETMKASAQYLWISAFVIGICSCGGGGGSSTTTSSGLSLTASVSTPTVSSNLAAGLKAVSVGKAVTETAAEGKEVVCLDTAGNEIGTGCTTGADGECAITGLTSAQLEAGVTVVSDPEGAPQHSYRIYESSETDTIAAGTETTVPVNTEEDIAYAVLKDACSNDLANCATTIDPKCIVEAIPTFIGDSDDTPSTSTLKGYAEAIYQAQATAIAAGSGNPADLLASALGGSPSGYTALAGSSVSDVPVSDAASNMNTLADTIVNSFCKPDASTNKSQWKEIKDAATTAGETFAPIAMLPFVHFSPNELTNYEVADFRGFAQALPNLEGAFSAFGAGRQQQLLARNLFREGAFADPTRAGPALAMGFAAIPSNLTGWDPGVSAQAANNAFLQYVDAAGTNFADPLVIKQKFESILTDATYKATLANGGKGAASFINAFVSDPTGFVPANFTGSILKPPGATCSSDDQCLPCDSCTNSVCTSNSSKMGAECTPGAGECDTITNCQYPPFAPAGTKGHCMCAANMASGAFVNNTGTVGVFGETSGFTPPPSGGEGGQCSATVACGGGLTCTSQSGPGVCVSGTFKKGPFAPCASSAECESNSCQSGQCTAGATAGGTKQIGAPCFAPSECATYACLAGVCSTLESVCSSCTNLVDNSLKKAAGMACTAPNECISGFCASGLCTENNSGFSGITGQPAGSYCNDGPQCASGFCNFSTMMCGG